MKNNYDERDIDKGIEVWQLNDIETWVGFGLNDIVLGAVKQTGLSKAELCDDLKLIPRSTWDNMYVTDTDAKFMPRYTYSNMIMKDVLENIEMPYILASTEY